MSAKGFQVRAHTLEDSSWIVHLTQTGPEGGRSPRGWGAVTLGRRADVEVLWGSLSRGSRNPLNTEGQEAQWGSCPGSGVLAPDVLLATGVMEEGVLHGEMAVCGWAWDPAPSRALLGSPLLCRPRCEEHQGGRSSPCPQVPTCLESWAWSTTVTAWGWQSTGFLCFSAHCNTQ